jgi:hypothetical protein
MQKTRNNDRGQAYLDWQRERAIEIEQETAAKAAADANDPMKQFEMSANASASTIRQSLVSSTPLGEDVLPGERIAGRKVVESALIANWKYWAMQGQGKAAGFQTEDASAVFDTWKANDLAPTAENFSAVFQLLKDYDLLPDAEPGSPDLNVLSQFGTPVQGEIDEKRASQEMEKFIVETGWRKSSKNGKLLLKTLTEDFGLAPFAENLRIVSAYLKANDLFPEPIEMTPSEQAAKNRNDYFNKVVVVDEAGKPWTSSELELLDSASERRLRRLAESGGRHSGNAFYQEYLDRRDIRQAKQAATDAEAQREGR